jgi:hypothetical protein
VPSLALVPVPGDEVPDETVAGHVGRGDAFPIPKALVTEGLELDPGEYDDDNPLLLKPDEIDEGVAAAAMPTGAPAPAAETALELQPVRFANGTPYRDEPAPEASLDSDPVAEEELARASDAEGAPQSGTVSASVNSSFVDDVLADREADRDEVIKAISRHGLVDEGDDATEYDPLVVDGREVIVVEADFWETEIAAEVGVGREALDAARESHYRQAAGLFERSNADEVRDVAPSRDAVVITRP